MMAKKKTNKEEMHSEANSRSMSLKELGIREKGTAECAAQGKGSKRVYDYDTLRGRKTKAEPEVLSDRIWFDDLPPHTD